MRPFPSATERREDGRLLYKSQAAVGSDFILSIDIPPNSSLALREIVDEAVFASRKVAGHFAKVLGSAISL